MIRQADPRWSSIKLGLGGSSIGGAGCVLCCIAWAARIAGTNANLTPDELNRRGVDAGAFAGSNAIIPKLAECAGLTAPDHQRIRDGDPGDMSIILQGDLVSGKMSLLHVDHDASLPRGDPGADHWILATRLEHGLDGTRIACSDPAPGEIVYISAHTLTGISVWKKTASGAITKTYRVLGMASIWRA